MSFHSELYCFHLVARSHCDCNVLFVPPATKLRQGNVFYTCLWFCPQGGGGSTTHPPGRHPLPEQTPPTPRADTPRADTPLGRHLPFLGRHRPGRHPLHGACWDTVNKQAVYILLECILVCKYFSLCCHCNVNTFTCCHETHFFHSHCRNKRVQNHFRVTSS